MEIEQIKRIYDAMADNDYKSLEVELNGSKLRLELCETAREACQLSPTDEACDQKSNELVHTQVEIRSDKVGVFDFADRELKPGDKIKKSETLGLIRGISFQDHVRCTLDGVVSKVEVVSGDVVDYGHLLFVVDID